MSILNKFAKVQIDPTKSLLKPPDIEFCNKLEADFKAAYSFYETKIEFLEINKADLQGNSFLGFEEMFADIESCIGSMSKSFIERTIQYFVNTYKISLTESEIIEKILPEHTFDRYGKFRGRSKWDDDIKEDADIRKKIARFNISLNSILEQITNKLGGLSLDEKAETELRDKFYEKFCKRYHSDKLELIKNRISFDNTYFSFDYWNGVKFEWRSLESLMILLKALSFFENGSLTEIMSEYNTLIKNEVVPEEIMFSEWKIGSDKISSIRFYKNRKMIIKFVSDEVASEFYKDMCKSGL